MKILSRRVHVSTLYIDLAFVFEIQTLKKTLLLWLTLNGWYWKLMKSMKELYVSHCNGIDVGFMSPHGNIY